ncbi:hypothetical protein [Microcoleus anatoxicus]|uniref:hypothetical protein n=1 Tax=Microcoleus anatoxicus TaxID=2705319 RepID=UPI0030C9F029
MFFRLLFLIDIIVAFSKYDRYSPPPLTYKDSRNLTASSSTASGNCSRIAIAL